MFLPPHHSALCNLSLFLSSFFLSCCVLFGFFFFSQFPSSVHSLPTPFPAHLLSLFSLFQFSGSLSSLLLCSFQPFLVHLTSATCPQLSLSLALSLSALICSHLPLTTPLLSCLHFLLPQRTKINVLFSQIAFRK